MSEATDDLVVARVLDVDSHEMIPTEMYGEVFSPALQAATREFRIGDRPRPNSKDMVGATGDVMEITHDTVWNVKGSRAPSAINLGRRIEVLDMMGIERQLVFPTFGLMALILRLDPNAHMFLKFDPERLDARSLGLEGIEAHNRWAVAMTKSTSGRARPVGIVLTETIDQMMRQAHELLAQGIRAVMISANVPPIDSSPADPALDPFWRLLAEANVPVTLHLGTDFGFVSSTRWSSNVEVFHPSDGSTLEFTIEPHRAATVHYGAENFLTAMVLGGVFERVPNLRFGVIELSASWIGPLADRLDMWVTQQFRKRFGKVLTMLPSEYIARNVRVTPFYFEPVARYLDIYPHLASVYCYSSDYPHTEGGQESLRVFSEGLRHVSAKQRDQFFYENALWLLPE